MGLIEPQNGSTPKPDISDPAFRRMAEKLQDATGIVLNDSKKGLAISRLGRRLRQLGVPDFSAYCDLLEGPQGDCELQEMILLLTTNVTRFFREGHHFTELRDTILPACAERVRRGGKLRIWSAGCSSGEEVYSLAMTILEVIPDANTLDVRVLGTDIDRNVIETARRAQYRLTDEDFAASPLMRANMVSGGSAGGMSTPSDNVKSLVRFARLNLLDSWPMQGRFDVIFCRNVVIYFSNETQEALWPRFADAMIPGGHLMIGHSERVTGSALSRLTSSGVTQYQLKP